MNRISSFMSLTTLVGASLGFAGSVTWLAIRLAVDGMPKDFFGEGFGWAMLLVGILTAFGGAIGLGIGLVYATYKLWMNEV
jgi:Zn-dependent membrane protease YugP